MNPIFYMKCNGDVIKWIEFLFGIVSIQISKKTFFIREIAIIFYMVTGFYCVRAFNVIEIGVILLNLPYFIVNVLVFGS